jgi:hypothetical protein
VDRYIVGRNAAVCLILISYVAYSSILRMEAACFIVMSTNFQWTMWSFIPVHRIIRVRLFACSHREVEPQGNR